MIITVSDQAHEQLRELGVGETTFLRLGVKPGGCSGMTYDARLDDELQSMDEVVYNRDAVRIVTDSQQKDALDGLEIGYSNDLVRSGFQLSNPNHVHSCGCGGSFSSDEGGCHGC